MRFLRYRFYSFCYLLSLCLSSCFWGAEHDNEEVIGNYRVVEDEVDGLYSLYYYNEGVEGRVLVPRPVVRVGHNQRIIIVETCLSRYAKPYFIVPVLGALEEEIPRITTYHNSGEEIKKKVLGPFTKQAFNQKMLAIGEDSLMEFDQHFNDCE